jgi:hypothetical protein
MLPGSWQGQNWVGVKVDDLVDLVPSLGHLAQQGYGSLQVLGPQRKSHGGVKVVMFSG